MNEEQAERMISLLERMNDNLETIKSNTDPTWNAQDVCSRLDDIAGVLHNQL